MANTNCEHFGRCGGCTYLDISYADELRIKETALRECMGEHANLLAEILPSPNQHSYRNKMELAFGDEGRIDGNEGRLALGMRKKRSFYEVATPLNCVLIGDDFKQIISFILDYFRESDEAFYHRKRHVGSLRHLVLRKGEFTGEILIMISTTSTLQTPLAPMVEGLLALTSGKIVGIMHSIYDGVADAVKSDDVRILWGRDYYNEVICGLKFKVGMFSFFQTNAAGAEVLYGVVQKFCETDCPTGGSTATDTGILPLAYDLYCGTGTIAQVIAPYFEKVMGIELVEEAISAAKDNAALNGITNCVFYAGDVLFEIDKLEANKTLSPVDVIVVDPPRDGLHAKALAKIAAFAPKKIIYVACKPASLARDMALLAESGYYPVRMQGVDLFPRTPHVECVCEFVKA